MTKKHFKQLAQIIKSAKAGISCGEPAEMIVNTLQADIADFCQSMNTEFDRLKFYAACEVERPVKADTGLSEDTGLDDAYNKACDRYYNRG